VTFSLAPNSYFDAHSISCGRACVHKCEQEEEMTRSLKAIGALVIVFTILAAVMNYFGLPHKSAASTASLFVIPAVTPEVLTRTAGPRPIDISQIHQNTKTLLVEKFEDMTFVISEGD
jgi:hypothetical protein